MILNGIIVSSFAQLHEALSTKIGDNEWIYRGQSNSDWPLLPKAGRDPFARYDDRRMLEAWKLRAIEYLDFRPNSDWEWLAIAQHYGLATRLLDWTQNPLIAAFFAANSESKKDAAIWCLRSSYNYSEKTQEKSPFEVNTIGKFIAYSVSRRISSQHSVFTIHPKPKISLNDFHYEDEDIISSIVIKANCKKSLLKDLSKYGVNYATIFPDLDGLARHFNWMSENTKRIEDR